MPAAFTTPPPTHVLHLASIPAMAQVHVTAVLFGLHVAPTVKVGLHLPAVTHVSHVTAPVKACLTVVYPCAQWVHPASGRVYPGLHMHTGPVGVHLAANDPGYVHTPVAAALHEVHSPVTWDRKYPVAHDVQSSPV